MIRNLCILITFLSWPSWAEKSNECSLMKKGILDYSRIYQVDINSKFSGTLSAIGKNNKKATRLKTASTEFKLPFIGKDLISLATSVNPIKVKNDMYQVSIVFYEAAKYSNVATDFLGYVNKSNIEVFQENVYHEWLEYEGLEHDINSFKCELGVAHALEISAYLNAKLLFIEQGADYYKLSDYKTAYLKFNEDAKKVVIKILDAPNYIEVSIKANNLEQLKNWLNL